MKLIKLILLTILIFSFSACTRSSQPSPTEGISAAAEQTQASIETETPTPTPTSTMVPTEIPPTATLVPTPTIVAPFSAQVRVASLGLRSGPSTFFPLLDYYPEGTNVIVSAQIPGSEWVYLTVADTSEDAWEATNNEIGWMSAQFLDIDEKYSGLPLMYYPDDQILVTYVFDTDGLPVNDITIAVSYTEGGGSNRNDSHSDSAGVSLTYFPAGYLGQEVAVSIAGLGCNSSIMNEDCKMTDYFTVKHYEMVTLPYEGFVDFTFETASIYVTGYVTNHFGNRVADVQVRGLRPEDEAYSTTYSDAEGNFTLPIGDGVWELFTKSYNPVLEGAHSDLDASEYNSEIINLFSP